jgi:hypothetical protein
MIAAGFENGDLKIFDLKTMKVFWETNVGNGVKFKSPCFPDAYLQFYCLFSRSAVQNLIGKILR